MKDGLVDVNVTNMTKITDVVFRTVDVLINSETEGILKRPSSSNEIEDFNASVKEIVVNKIRNKLGV